MSDNISTESLEMIGERIKVILSEQPQAFARLQTQLAKFDRLDGIKKCLNELNIELEISRHERQLRLASIELRGKQP